MSIFRTKLIFKRPTPYTLSARAVTQGITRLEHEFLDDSVKYDIVVISIFGVRDEVFDRLWCCIWEQLEVLVIVSIPSWSTSSKVERSVWYWYWYWRRWAWWTHDITLGSMYRQ